VLIGNSRGVLGGAYRFHHQGNAAVEYPEVGGSKHLHTSVTNYQSTRRRIVEDFIFTTRNTKSAEIFQVRR
jgi:hypothetical protein